MRQPRLVTVLFAASLLSNLVLWTQRDTSAVGSWRSRGARDSYLAAYAEVQRTMPAPTQQREIATSYGSVHVDLYAGAHPERTPILLMPGWGSGIPMWKGNLPGLIAERPAYALDALGDAGLSTQAVPLDTPEAQAAWVREVVAALGVPRVHVVGHSFGGWSAANFALRDPEHVASLSLLEPVQVFSPLTAQLYLWSIPANIPLLPQGWRDHALARIGGTDTIDHADPMTRMIDEGTKGYASKRSFPQAFTDDQLRGLRMPVYAGLAADSTVLADPPAGVRRAESLVPTVEARLWASAGHSLPMERSAEVDATVLGFMARHDR